MNKIKKITRSIWLARKTISFGQTDSWDSDTFRKKWVEDFDKELWDNKPGWYWIESDISASEFSKIQMPLNLPNKAINFGEVARKNISRFADSDLNNLEPLKVVYSGQEYRVFSRLRTHFSLSENNTATGALGISSYPLSSKVWSASFFHSGMISNLNELSSSEKDSLNILIQNTHSRDLIESCWRLEYGWPILCLR